MPIDIFELKTFAPVPNTHGDITCQHMSDAEYAELLKKLERAVELCQSLVHENK